MYSSQTNKDIIFLIYNQPLSVFRLSDIAMLVGETNFNAINQKLHYYVRTGKLLNPRRGIYTKLNYTPEELANKIYTPSYISLEYVLQQTGVVFQYDEQISSISYLSREIMVDAKRFSYRKIKNQILVNTQGIIQKNGVNIAIPERAFLDLLYLNTEYYFDNLHAINVTIVNKLLPLYGSKALTTRVQKLLKNNGH